MHLPEKSTSSPDTGIPHAPWPPATISELNGINSVTVMQSYDAMLHKHRFDSLQQSSTAAIFIALIPCSLEPIGALHCNSVLQECVYGTRATE